MTNADLQMTEILRDVEPSALSTGDLRDYVDRIVHLADNTDLMDDEQAKLLPCRTLVRKLRECYKALIERYNREDDPDRRLLLLHSATRIAHCSLIVESDPLVERNDQILDQLFMRAGVYDNHLVPDMDETLLITLVGMQTKTWADEQLDNLVSAAAARWQATDPDRHALTPEQAALRRNLIEEYCPAAADNLQTIVPQ